MHGMDGVVWRYTQHTLLQNDRFARVSSDKAWSGEGYGGRVIASQSDSFHISLLPCIRNLLNRTTGSTEE